MTAVLYSTIWVALTLFTVAEAGKRQFASRGSAPGWAWPAWLSGAVLCTLHLIFAFAVRHGWSQASALRETARQTAAVYGVEWGGGVYVNYFFVALWWFEAWWWRVSPAGYFSRGRAITWMIRAFYFLIIVNAAVVFAAAERRALGVGLVGALAWIWRPARGAGVPAGQRARWLLPKRS